MDQGGLPPPTKAESERMGRLKRMGCLACRQEGLGQQYADAHHLTEGDTHGAPRRGHAYTVALCPWHHRGIPPEGRSEGYARAAYGPSLARQPVAFRRKYGSGDALLLKQERLLRRDVWS